MTALQQEKRHQIKKEGSKERGSCFISAFSFIAIVFDFAKTGFDKMINMKVIIFKIRHAKSNKWNFLRLNFK